MPAPDDSTSGELPGGTTGWRSTATRSLHRLPKPARDAVWRFRRAAERSIRRSLEARGNFSRSAPALFDMDRKLSRYLDYEGGFFIEAGANDGFHQSNTYLLERERGWRGVLVEPVPALFDATLRERPSAHVYNCALVAEDYSADRVQLVYGGMMTTVVGARGSETADRDWVRAAHAVVQEEPEHDFSATPRTLTSILDEVGAPEIDFFSLDVEGFEVQVLGGLDFNRYAPKWLLVEIREHATSRAAIESILGARYEFVEPLSPFDVLYRRR
jgi:FkbM family methyltransferase